MDAINDHPSRNEALIVSIIHYDDDYRRTTIIFLAIKRLDEDNLRATMIMVQIDPS